MSVVTIESLLHNIDRLFIPSPCILRSDTEGFEAVFNRDSDDAESVLKAIFTKHFGTHSVEISDWVSWGMEDQLPRSSDTHVIQRRIGGEFHDWMVL